MNSFKSLRYHLIDTRHPAEGDRNLCARAYEFWRSSWAETFGTLGVDHGPRMMSDDFLDREAGVLTHEGRPIGLFLNNWLDLSRDAILDHSYFKNYPAEVLARYRDLGFERVMVLSYMTLDPEWRRADTDVKISDLLFSLALMRFREAGTAALIGYIRADNSTHEIFTRHGGQRVAESIVYNVPVHYCYLTPQTARLSDLPGVRAAALYLWNTIKREEEVPVHPLEKALDTMITPYQTQFLSFPWETERAYAHYLANTYRYIQHSTKLLAYAADRAGGEDLRACLRHHVAEEQGHELWALGDLKRLGYDISKFPELPEARALYESIYQGIDRDGPAAIIGYAMALEGLSARACPAIAQRLVRTYGETKCVLIKSHGELDQEHVKEGVGILRFFEPREHAVILRHMTESLARYGRFLAQIEASAGVGLKAA